MSRSILLWSHRHLTHRGTNPQGIVESLSIRSPLNGCIIALIHEYKIRISANSRQSNPHWMSWHYVYQVRQKTRWSRPSTAEGRIGPTSRTINKKWTRLTPASLMISGQLREVSNELPHAIWRKEIENCQLMTVSHEWMCTACVAWVVLTQSCSPVQEKIVQKVLIYCTTDNLVLKFLIIVI